jgi:hypothetical protein
MIVKGDISLFAKDLGKVRLQPSYLDALISDAWLQVANELIAIRKEYNIAPERMRLYIKLASQLQTNLLTAVRMMASGQIEVRVETTPDAISPDTLDSIGA